MSPYFAMVAIGLFASLVAFALIWYLQYRLKDAGVVDVFWPLSVSALGIFYCMVSDGEFSRRAVVGVLIAGWSLRLSYHLFERWQKSAEDSRYAELKKKWGNQAQARMFRFYQFQALGALLFSMPLLMAATNRAAFGMWDVVGMVVWMIALFGEAIADRQLERFKRIPENKLEVCRSGLWKYSRHPNYFFEWLHWCAYVFFCITMQWGWLSIIAPIAMWYFLNFVTGIPNAEEQSVKSRGEKYVEYQKVTSPFFPWFPGTAN